MFVIVGLGNPGRKYVGTRHNIGRSIVERFAVTAELTPFAPHRRIEALTTTGVIDDERILLALPECYMNESGTLLPALLRAAEVDSTHLIVVHDDADLPLGSGKISFERGAGGHHGIESVISVLGTNRFWRFRIGIASVPRKPAELIVLKKFSNEEHEIAERIIEKTVAALHIFVTKGSERAINVYHQSE